MIYRLYFNRCEDFPQIWSVDEGTPETEINVVGVRVNGLRVTSRIMPREKPSGWFEVDGTLTVTAGIAVFS